MAKSLAESRIPPYAPTASTILMVVCGSLTGGVAADVKPVGDF